MIGHWPRVNCCSAFSRSHWSLSPWMAHEPTPSLRCSKPRRSHSALVLQKTMTLVPSLRPASTCRGVPKVRR
eukprot:5517919-Prymnesium_polylepis.1